MLRLDGVGWGRGGGAHPLRVRLARPPSELRVGNILAVDRDKNKVLDSFMGHPPQMLGCSHHVELAYHISDSLHHDS